MAILTRVALCIVALSLTAACRTGQEQWGPLRGRVVDAETGAPIAGAHVMALWVRDRPSLHSKESAYDARETVTDRDGRFELPYERRWMTAWVNAPGISVFAPDYQVQRPIVTPLDGRPYVDPTVVPMRPLKTHEERCGGYFFLPALTPPQEVPRYAEATRQYLLSLPCGGRG